MVYSDLGLIYSEVIADRRARREGECPSAPSLPTPGVTVFGCDEDEAGLFRELVEHVDVSLRIVDEAVCDANVELARGSRCVSVSHKAPVTSSILAGLRSAGVEYISTRSVGYNHIDLGYAERVGISVGNVAYSPDSVADYTLMLMLMAVRHAKSTVRRTDAHDYRLSETRGKELRDLTVGVVGTGHIGTEVIERLRGFGCRILAHDSRPQTRADYVTLDDLTEHSDIVTLHIPLTTDTHHLLDRRRIERMRPGAYVINTGRGALLDTEALLSALESGRLGGAALDVLEGEDGIFYTDCRNKTIDNEVLIRLQRMPNVLISPHSAYYTEHALRETVENSLINCMNFGSESNA